MEGAKVRFDPDHLASRAIEEYDAWRIGDLEQARPLVGTNTVAMRGRYGRLIAQSEAHDVELRKFRFDFSAVEYFLV